MLEFIVNLTAVSATAQGALHFKHEKVGPGQFLTHAKVQLHNSVLGSFGLENLIEVMTNREPISAVGRNVMTGDVFTIGEMLVDAIGQNNKYIDLVVTGPVTHRKE